MRTITVTDISEQTSLETGTTTTGLILRRETGQEFFLPLTLGESGMGALLEFCLTGGHHDDRPDPQAVDTSARGEEVEQQQHTEYYIPEPSNSNGVGDNYYTQHDEEEDYSGGVGVDQL